MDLSFTTFVWFLLLNVVLSLPGPSFRVVESLPSIPEGWVKGPRADSGHVLNFRLHIESPRVNEFQQFVFDASTPGHTHYGRRLSKADIASFLQPRRHVTLAILSWLERAGIPKIEIQEDSNWITFKAPVRIAEQLLDAQFHLYSHEGKSIVRTLRYSVPSNIYTQVNMIQPTTRFGQLRPQGSWLIGDGKVAQLLSPQRFDSISCNTSITPGCLRTLYQLDNFTAFHGHGNSLGISGFLDQYAQNDDWHAFANLFAPYAQTNNFSVATINGGLNLQHNASSDSREANLDIQYGMSLTAGTPTVYYTTGGRGPLVQDLDQPNINASTNEPYLEELLYLNSLPDEDLPTVLTTSYGDVERSIPREYAKSTCLLFAQLGARGVSVIFSSGDSGVGSSCESNDGTNSTRFDPIYPATCPFVTSVGGTVGVKPERAAAFSSGGFSDIFDRPGYQDGDVCAYLDRLGNKFSGLYNRNGRGFPDVAAQSMHFAIYDKGMVKFVSGTSASAPTFAAIISNVNSVRMKVGLPSLGFLNPFLYGLGKLGLTDIVEGGSTGCTGSSIYSGLPGRHVPYAGWNATKGWDPVTGLGTPLFRYLLQISLATTNITTSPFDTPPVSANSFKL